MDGIRNTGRKIMIKLSLDDDKIRVGSKIGFIFRIQAFSHDGIDYGNIDTLNAIATVHGIEELNETYKCKFDDISFFPTKLQSVAYWYLPQAWVEKL